MRTDDHEFIRGLAGLEFIYEPFVAFIVESAACTAAILSVSSRTMTLIGTSAFG